MSRGTVNWLANAIATGLGLCLDSCQYKSNMSLARPQARHWAGVFDESTWPGHLGIKQESYASNFIQST